MIAAVNPAADRMWLPAFFRVRSSSSRVIGFVISVGVPLNMATNDPTGKYHNELIVKFMQP
jgi:hypothetical protein